MNKRAVTIAIPTLGRPQQLSELLAAVNPQAEGARDVAAKVLVIDNDPEGTAAEVARAAGATHVVEPTKGLTPVRNRALDIAFTSSAEALVFIDDDEVPEPGWLDALLEPWLAGRADMVAGEVVSRFNPEPDPWIEAGGFFRRVKFSEGTLMSAAPTNNLLIDVAFVRSVDLRFDERFSETGGEDIHFTGMAARAGARIVSAPSARVIDPVSPARATRSWVLQRAYRVGTTTVHGDLVLTPRGHRRVIRRARWLALGAARVVAGTLRRVGGRVRGSLVDDARGARLVARGGGMVAAAVGAHYDEYARRTTT